MQYAADVAHGMSHLHENRILHGDLKVSLLHAWKAGATVAGSRALHAESCSSDFHYECTCWLQLDNVLIKHVTAEGSDSCMTYAKVWCQSC
jgi:serine/threonine protein kinase